MIVTLTLNPSVDRTLAVTQVCRGQVLRATSSRVDAGGKGINVARALSVNGLKTRAVVAIGGPEGDHLSVLLADAGIEVLPVPIHGSIRSNVTVIEPDGTTTKINEPGATLSGSEVSRIVSATVEASSDAQWLVASGSLPPGVPATAYADVVAALAGTTTRVAVDTSGPALAATLSAGPALVKPNLAELQECVGSPLETLGDVVAACRSLRERGAHVVLASLGSSGALLLDGDIALFAHCPAVVPVSPVGAGDALLAGFLAAGGEGAQALIEAVAWGAAAVTLAGSRMPSPADLHREQVVLERSPQLDLPLRDTR